MISKALERDEEYSKGTKNFNINYCTIYLMHKLNNNCKSPGVNECLEVNL